MRSDELTGIRLLRPSASRRSVARRESGRNVARCQVRREPHVGQRHTIAHPAPCHAGRAAPGALVSSTSSPDDLLDGAEHARSVRIEHLDVQTVAPLQVRRLGGTTLRDLERSAFDEARDALVSL